MANVKMEMRVCEKYNVLFPWNLGKSIFFGTREKNVFREKYENFAIFFLWERKSTREKFWLPVNM